MASLRKLALVLLAGALSGCESVASPARTTAPLPATPPAPAERTVSAQTGGLYGIVTEITASGARPVEGVTIALLSCARPDCGSGGNVYKEGTTVKDGTYDLTDLYNSDRNYIWLTPSEKFTSAEPIPVLGCDSCDLIARVDGKTRLDINVTRFDPLQSLASLLPSIQRLVEITRASKRVSVIPGL